MSRQYQYSLLPSIKPEFGGSLNSGKRKSRRPLTTRKPMHVVFRSSMAKGDLSFLRPKNNQVIRRILSEETKRKGICTYRLSINSNHFHFLLQGRSRREIQGFFRAFSGRVAMALTGAARGRALGRRFWDHVVFTRIVEWGRAFRAAAAYVVQNENEASGLIPYRERGSSIKRPVGRPSQRYWS